jgi:protease IV
MGLINRIFVVIGWCVLGLMGVVFAIGLMAYFSKSGESSSLDAKTDRAVAVVELSGEILSADAFIKDLKDAASNEKIKAIVVRIESPGGSVGASEEIYREIKSISARKPVACSMGNVAASGGLYVALGCKRIWANNGTLTGSIGVILMMPNFHSVMKTFGLSMTVVKSGPFKDSGSPFREFTPADENLVQGLVDSAYNQFVDIVVESRHLSADEVKKFADGRILLGSQAVQVGLIDAIGGISDAAQAVLNESGVSGEPELVRIKKRSGLMKFLEESTEIPLLRIFRSASEMRLMYM